ncbi:Rv3235 family protein [Cryobacterium lyxosi]|uniref:3-hydroxyacyl-CoA dehydrogenase n=1 Tax=Cryobacterium lyxosi TaxID=1259228 RepID=A0A4V6QI20_9MICO|nr:Rv3235 family protein [Cryobacterium lyxosi]TFD28046.1 3-hydroxyacyl-CoA dehydrogenase [Cryobacterium lyxosi]
MTSSGSGASSAQVHPSEAHNDARRVSPKPIGQAHRPEPEQVLRALALRAVEVIAGARDLEQLARWVTDDVYAHLRVRVSIAARARAITGVVAERPRLWIDHVTTWPTDTGGFNAVILVYDKRRAHVVSVQLEGLDQRWRATVLVVL